MFEWLSGLSPWFQKLVTLGVFGLLAFVVFASVRMGVYFHFKNAKFQLGRRDRDGKEVDSPHAACPHVKDIIIMLNDTQRILDRRGEIRHYETLTKQMNYVDEKANLIKGELLKVYLELLKQKGVEHPTQSASYDAYQLVLKVIRNEIVTMIRIMIRENNFDKFSEQSFHLFTENKIEALITTATSSLNMIYLDSNVISRQEIYEANMGIVSDIRKSAREMFITVRKIACDYHKELEVLDEKMADVVGRVIGVEYVVRDI